MTRIASIGAAIALALSLVAGCGDDQAATPAAPSPPPGATGATGAMPAGDLSLTAAGLSVTEVLADTTDGPLAARAFLVVDSDGARLCDALAESFPPQCGGDRIPVTGLPPELIDGLRAESGRRWSEEPIQLIGSVRDGVFVNDALALAAS